MTETVTKALDPSSWSPSITTLGSAVSLSHGAHSDSIRATGQVRPEASDIVTRTVVPAGALTSEHIRGRPCTNAARTGANQSGPVSSGLPTASRTCCWWRQRSVYSRAICSHMGARFRLAHLTAGPAVCGSSDCRYLLAFPPVDACSCPRSCPCRSGRPRGRGRYYSRMRRTAVMEEGSDPALLPHRPMPDAVLGQLQPGARGEPAHQVVEFPGLDRMTGPRVCAVSDDYGAE